MKIHICNHAQTSRSYIDEENETYFEVCLQCGMSRFMQTDVWALYKCPSCESKNLEIETEDWGTYFGKMFRNFRCKDCGTTYKPILAEITKEAS